MTEYELTLVTLILCFYILTFVKLKMNKHLLSKYFRTVSFLLTKKARPQGNGLFLVTS